MSDPFAQFKQTYINECLELLADMEEKLLGLDASANSETLNAIFRCAHSIKGGAGAFNFTNIASFTHILEALLDKMREGHISPTPPVVDCLLRARDVVQQMVMAASANQSLPDDFGSALAAELSSFTPGAAPVVSAAAASVAAVSGKPVQYDIFFKPKSSLIAHGNEPLLLLRELAQLGDIQVEANISAIPELDAMEADGCYISWNIQLTNEKPEAAIREVFEFVEDECELTITAHTLADASASSVIHATASETPKQPATANAAPAAANPQATSIRVDTDKVDKLINMVGEIVISQAFLSAQVKDLPPAQFAELMRGIEEMQQHIRELQEAVMSVRMQPVKSIFSRMPRLVRDLAQQLGKEITLELSGENTEVDKTIIEQLSDPLTHMIRNSVDHGVEMPDIRAERGKPRMGTIHLSAEHRGGRIVIEVSDDGGGINREKVLKKAREKGIVGENETLTDNEIDMLIFAPGFSTAETVTNVSGRGVGMDVVRRNIESLGGYVQVENFPGKGSTFTISLPLTLAILDGMIVRCGSEFYIVPINSIIETMRPKASEVRPLASGGSVINVRGEFLPIVYLHEVFHIRGAERDASKALVVLVESGKAQLGLVVDELVGQQQVVIKSLEENSDPIEGVSGATILGDGKVSLILDVAALYRISKQAQQHANDNSHIQPREVI
jgi:two-component system chemotaxis sensor kinase CheA